MRSSWDSHLDLLARSQNVTVPHNEFEKSALEADVLDAIVMQLGESTGLEKDRCELSVAGLLQAQRIEGDIVELKAAVRARIEIVRIQFERDPDLAQDVIVTEW